jgi:NitT/TauT family transport system permease protein
LSLLGIFCRELPLNRETPSSDSYDKGSVSYQFRAGPDREAALNQPLFRRIWGGAAGWLDRSRKLGWTDVLFVLVVVALVVGVFNLAQEWGTPRTSGGVVSTSPWMLPIYTFYSLTRGVIAYVLSLLFTLVYGYWAAKDKVAQRVLIPLLDILQSIPVLGFAPALILVLVALFPGNNIGLELAAILSIFTGQAWNMTFSFYQSVRSVPTDMHEAATVYRFTWWQRFRWVELPFSAIGLIWNSMMSMAGGWFFLATIEGLEIGSDRYWLPGIGSYIHQASSGDKWDWTAIWLGVLAMTLMIVGLDQLFWRPVVAWAQKFRIEEGGAQEETTSWFLGWLRRSRLISAMTKWLGGLFRRERFGKASDAPAPVVDPTQSSPAVVWASRGLFLALVGVLVYGGWCLVQLILGLPLADWGDLGMHALWTLCRVLVAVAVGTLWAVPAGLAIGLSPRLSRLLQPVVQVMASFPAPLIFPLVIVGLEGAALSFGWDKDKMLDWGSVLLMLLGTQWYILFNVIAGAMAVPADLKEAARSYNITGWQRFRVLYFPALFPFLVTGWVTAAGGAWNASIVAEFGKDSHNQTVYAHGLGADIMEAAAGWRHPGTPPEAADPAQEMPPNYTLLAASVLIMSFVVVLFNRVVWRQLYALAEKRFSITR